MNRANDGSGLLMAVSYAHHCVKIYNDSDGSLVSVIGQPAKSGNIDVGKLWNPHSALRLSNGNILVSSYNGRGVGGTNHGSITEWNISTPVAILVQTHMYFHSSGHSGVGSNIVYRPMRMIWDNDGHHIWVYEYGRNKILKVDPSTWSVVSVLETPSNSPLINTSFGMCQMSDNTIVVSSNSSKTIIGIDPSTKKLAFTINPSDYGAVNPTLRGICELEPGYLVWTDQALHGVFVSKVGNVDVPFETPVVPEGWQVVNSTSSEMTDYMMSVPDHQIAEKVKPTIILTEQIQ